MSLISNESIGSLNIYEEILNEETEMDLSGQNLEEVPKLDNTNLLSLHLQNNKIAILPDDFFPSLKYLMWLDLRDNRLTDLPKSIQHHQGLTHLLLQNNCLTSLPNELGTLSNLKVLQLNGNPLMYPPREIINAGVSKILEFLNGKYIESMVSLSQSDITEDTCSISSQKGIDSDEFNPERKKSSKIMVKFNEKELEESPDKELYSKIKGKCPKLDKSRHTNLPPYCQSSKCLKALRANSKLAQTEKMKQGYLKEVAMKKHKDLLMMRDKILQERKNIESLRNWRQSYRYKQLFTNPDFRLEANTFPYDTSPEYMTLLTREDIEKDLPDKYRKNLVRRSRPSVPRKANDVHLAKKIKELFENLEKIDLKKEGLTPRSEQKMLLNEIHKITEIKQKLLELSSSNFRSLSAD